MRALLPFLLWLAALAGAATASAQEFPQLAGRVTDTAAIIPDDVEARLTQKLETLETQSQRQLVVATIPDLQGFEISDYGYRLGREWGIGDKERNDGALLIVAPNERKVRIEVGYGLEPLLTDGLSWQIINNEIVPRFKDGDMPGGIEAGVDAMVTQLTLPPEEAQRIAAEAEKAPETDWFGLIFFLIFFGLFFGIPILSAMGIIKAARHGSRRGGSTVWSTGGWSSGSSGWSGGGGFSGGGGSFGGGGSSGSW